MDLVVFDLDGTLVDSENFFLECAQRALKPFGLRASPELIESVRARHPHQLFHHILGPVDGEKAIKILYQEAINATSKIKTFPGIIELVEDLAGQGKPLAIWTGRDRESTAQILHYTGLGRSFHKYVSGTCVNQNKPAHDGLQEISQSFATNYDKIIVVGDHAHDIVPANELGCESVHARWKPIPQELPQEVKPKHAFSEVSDFHQWVVTTLA